MGEGSAAPHMGAGPRQRSPVLAVPCPFLQHFSSQYKPDGEQMQAQKPQEDILAIWFFSPGEDLLRGLVQLRVV